MILKKLSILNYKNILQAEVSFSPEINCFFGNNGMGKTNLLDAVHYLSFCKSHINTPDSQLINNGQDMCVLQGNYDYVSWLLHLVRIRVSYHEHADVSGRVLWFKLFDVRLWPPEDEEEQKTKSETEPVFADFEKHRYCQK